MRVYVYWNIHKGCWSVKALEGVFKQRVIGHPHTIRLDRARFHVQQGGRDRVLKQGQKTVHAGVVGDLVTALGAEEEMADLPSDFNDPPPMVSAPTWRRFITFRPSAPTFSGWRP